MLNIISKAWGKQEGYCFFPYIDREAQLRTGNRRDGYNEGPKRDRTDDRGPAFCWPKDRGEVLRYLQEHLERSHDVYWCPSLFEYPQRRTDLAMDEHCLWADLDEVDPRNIDPEYEPTIAWESSPGRFQALWLAANGDFQGSSWPGNENQRLTYYLGADPSGWDTTQLLRLPGWPNNKPERVAANGGVPPLGRLLYSTGPRYRVGDFSNLPEVRGAVSSDVTEALESEIDRVDRHKVLARLKLKMNHTARELLNAREVSGDRSSQMWYLMRCLADAGGTTTEIVAIVRQTVWNKFADRADELKRLIAEASKAVASISEQVQEQFEEEGERVKPQRLGFLLRNIKRPVWLIDGILTQGACGFIAGEPKTWKSWIGYDMALSVATGADFLDHFKVVEPGPVLYIQEEDPLPVLKTRGAKIWAGKARDKLVLEGENGIFWLPPREEAEFDPDIMGYIQQGVTLSDEAWQLWLDETIEEGLPKIEKALDSTPYRLMLVDTLMMTAGSIDENRAQEMTTKIFRPLKVLSRKHNIGVMVVHHLAKSDRPRMGQRLLGSVANHAWSEDSLYLLKTGHDTIKLELESKVAPGAVYRISNVNNGQWNPVVGPWTKEDGVSQTDTSAQDSRQRTRSSRSRTLSQAGRALDELGGVQGTREIADQAGLNYQQTYRQLGRDTLIEKAGPGRWRIKEKK
jgi:hypothetical protein